MTEAGGDRTGMISMRLEGVEVMAICGQPCLLRQ